MRPHDLTGRTCRILLAVLGLACVTGPVALADGSTNKDKTDLAVQKVALGEISLADKETPTKLKVPATLVHDQDVVFRGTLRWPREWGKPTFIHVQFYNFNEQIKHDVILTETLGKATEKDGVLHFETVKIKSPVKIIGKCKIKASASVIPADYDPNSGVPPESELIVLGVGDVEMR